MLFSNIYNFIDNNFFLITIFLSFIFLMFGSFLNVFLYRGNLKEINNNFLMIGDYLKEQNIELSNDLENKIQDINNNNLSLSFPSSHCPKCKNKLKWWHNIPLISYILLKGNCFFCKEKISIQYPFIEALTCIVLTSGWIALFHFFASPIFLIYFCALIITWMILLFDYKYYIIPDYLSYALIWIGLIFSTLNLTLVNSTTSIYGAVAGFMSLFIISFIGKIVKGQEAMGGGDLKLLAGLGAFIGFKAILPIIGISAFVGILTFIIFKYIHKNKESNEKNMLPYGPALIISFWIFLFYGNDLLKILL